LIHITAINTVPRLFLQATFID